MQPIMWDPLLHEEEECVMTISGFQKHASPAQTSVRLCQIAAATLHKFAF